jgi:hypothetical protein
MQCDSSVCISNLTGGRVFKSSDGQVARELDSLKLRGGSVEAAARQATKWLLHAVEAGRTTGLFRAQVSGSPGGRLNYAKLSMYNPRLMMINDHCGP